MTTSPRHLILTTFRSLVFSLALLVTASHAQEMEPDAYSRAPVGTNYVLFTYAYQTGDIFTDAALPLEDVSIKLHSGSVAAGRTFGLFGRQASVGVFAPYIHGKARGTVFEDVVEVTRSGLGDARFRFAMNIIGSPALS